MRMRAYLFSETPYQYSYTYIDNKSGIRRNKSVFEKEIKAKAQYLFPIKH